MSYGWVYIVVDLDGEEYRVAVEMFDMGDNDPQEMAKRVLASWDGARDKAERTLRLFGAEGLVREMLEAGESNTGREPRNEISLEDLPNSCP